MNPFSPETATSSTNDALMQLSIGCIFRTIALKADCAQVMPSESDLVVDCVGQVYIFGGQGESGMLNDMWEYNMDSMHWTQVTYYHSIGGHG